MKAVRALRRFMSMAVFTESPELSSTAKSPERPNPDQRSRSVRQLPVEQTKQQVQWPLTHLVRDLVAQDGHGGRHSSLGRKGEGRPDDQAIGKVVEAVSHNYHHGQPRNPLSWEHKGGCVVKDHPQTGTIALSCRATNYKNHMFILVRSCSSCCGSLLWWEGLLVSACSGDISVHSKSSTGPCRIHTQLFTAQSLNPLNLLF